MSYCRPSSQARRSLGLRVVLSVALLVGLAGCDSDSPTEPRQTPTPPPGPITQSFRVTVTANPNQLEAGGDPSTVTVTVVNAESGQPVPNNTTVVVSTTLGSFGSAGSGVQSGSVELVNGSAQLQLFPGDATGTAVVRAQIQQSAGQTNVQIVDAPLADRFFLETVSPTTGSPNGGDVLRISGNGFLEPVRVFVGAAIADVLNVTPTLIRVRIPPVDLPVGQSLSVDVSVTNDLNGETQATDTLPGAFTYTRGGGGGPLQPLVFSVTPNHGPNEGGTQVVIEGDGFESPVQVLFGNGSAANSFSGIEAQLVSVTRTRIVARSPAATAFGQINLNEEIDILVRNVNSGAAAIFSNAFRYGVDVIITALSPSEGPYTGGTLVTLFGQGFDEPVAVGLAGFGQQIVSVTGTEIIVRTVSIDPDTCQDIPGPSEVTNIETGDGNTGPSFTYRVASFGPFVSGVSPSVGTGGTVVTITGANFVQPLEVVFATESDNGGGGGNEANGTILSVPSTGQMTVRVPQFPNTAFQTEACDDNGDGTEGTRLIDTPVSITVTNLVTTCTETFERAFTLDAPSNACQNDIGEPPEPPEPPQASFESQTVVGNTVQFTDTSTGNPTSWSWDFTNDGIVDSTLQHPQFNYGAPGNYAVRLQVTNPGGSSSTVKVIAVP